MKDKKTPLKFRHELKYVIDEAERRYIKNSISSVLQADLHTSEDNTYSIRSLYFDDVWQSAYNDKMAGVNERSKYRIRIYNYSDSVIKLERKAKSGQYINKVSASLTHEEVDSILRGEFSFLLDKENMLCRDFYMECMTNLMRPNVIVDYEREPYVLPYGDVRITFDSRVRAGLTDFNIFDASIPVYDVLDGGSLIMEVKFTEYLPKIVIQLLPTSDSVYTSASKYVMCMEKKNEMMGYE